MQRQSATLSSPPDACGFSIDVWTVKRGRVHLYPTCFKIMTESEGIPTNVTRGTLDFDGFNGCRQLCRHCLATYNHVPEF